MPRHSFLATATLLLLSCAQTSTLSAEPIPAKYVQGSIHGYLLLKSAEGKTIAYGELVQIARAREVSSRLIYRFLDGSIDDETTIFTQGRVLKLVSDHHIQKGPSFPQSQDLAFRVATSEATWHETKDGKDEVKTEHVDLPDDMANGLVPFVIQSMPSQTQEMKVSYLVGTPKPRIVKLSIKPEGVETFHFGRQSHRAKKFSIHIELGGIVGVIAPLVGKQPTDLHIWVTDDTIPTVAKTEGASFGGGPIWTMELASPVWSKEEK